MAKLRNRRAGFSLVEMLVAMVFIGVLMAGMATVFKAGVTSLSTSGEGIASTRRNRMATGMLSADLNAANMYLVDLSSPPNLSTGNPAFYILPNMPVAGASATDPQTADQLFVYVDQPLPFEGVLSGTGGAAMGMNALGNSSLVMAGTAAPATNNQFTVECGTATYASMVQAGNYVVLKDQFEEFTIQGAPTVVGSKVTFSTGPSPLASMTGQGPAGIMPGQGTAGALMNHPHNQNSQVLFFQPGQMIQFQVVMKQFDPQKATGTPCLVREQGTYNGGGFVANAALETIVAENVGGTNSDGTNVPGFKVYLSGNSGQGWAGLAIPPKTYSGFNAGWTLGVLAELNAQLAAAGRPGYTTTAGNANWTRDIPTLVRLDITTRTATARSEYSATPATARDYRYFTQSLVMVPRHFGLTMK